MDATMELPFRFETLTIVADGIPIGVVENAHTDRVVVQSFPAS